MSVVCVHSHCRFMNIEQKRRKTHTNFSTIDSYEISRETHQTDSVSDITLRIGVDEDCDIEDDDDAVEVEARKKRASIQNLNLLYKQPNLMNTDYNR